MLLSDFPHLVGEVQVFDSLKVAAAARGGDSFTRRSFETSQGWAQWQLVNCQLVLITEVVNLHPTKVSLSSQLCCSTVLRHSLFTHCYNKSRDFDFSCCAFPSIITLMPVTWLKSLVVVVVVGAQDILLKFCAGVFYPRWIPIIKSSYCKKILGIDSLLRPRPKQ